MEATTLKHIKDLLLELRLAIDELDTPTEIIPIKADEVELEGIIGRPEMKEVRGRTVFTAGLGVKEGADTQWYALNAYGNVAADASTLLRGQVVRVLGKSKHVQFVDSYGVLRSKRQLTATLISPVSSETTGSRAESSLTI